ncbi:SAM-dependent methyltransferase [Nocardia sp. NBC_01499]|uniref:SAM-dependent methyltransferase n=1 Tax=Nocardia sp. NBC_01499 TaxID=2903597 RepID=UPI0038702660
MASSDSTSMEFDQSKPSISRVYDALLGGQDNFPIDRDVVAHLRQTMPQVDDIARLNRTALGRGVRYLAGEAGLRQFLDLGAGLPTMENTHQVAQALQPDARVVYVDKDPMVRAHGQALLKDHDQARVITADLRTPEHVLTHPDVQQVIDFDEPVAVMLVGVLHHLHDDEDPEGIVDAYMNAVPSGSHLFITHFIDTGAEARELEKSFLEFLGTGRFRTQDEILRLFRGFDLIEPGLVPLPQWRPDGAAPSELTLIERLIVGGIARKP